MKANKMFFVIIAIVVAMVGGIIWFLFGGTGSTRQDPDNSRDVLDISLKDLTPEELRAMGIEGDTPQDTVRTLIGTVKSNNKKVEEIIAQNEQLNRENDRLRDKNNNLDYQIGEAVRAETQGLLNEIQTLRGQLETAKNQLVHPNGENVAVQGQTGGIAVGNSEYSVNGNMPEAYGMQWVEPSDRVGLDGNGNVLLDNVSGTAKFGFPNDFSGNNKNSSSSTKGLPLMPNTDETSGNAIGNAINSTFNRHSTPFYTIPDNSTLMGATAMTALVGRVPINNNVTEPYPFKLLISRENLMANGIELPDIEGAIVSGNATGDWTLSCVRGTITSFTFVFQDGRINTVSQGGSNTVSSGNQGSLGWLSDNSGIPCVPGKRKTNAPEYLTTNFFLSGAAAAAQGLSQSQTTTVVDGNSIVGAVTGEQGKFILGQALGGGLRETADWVRQRFGQTFDAIYVPPGHNVAIHISQQIAIDYDTGNRKVKYTQVSSSSKLD
ncbi:TIGR03752 family integrating conjugative element protein [Caviibacterium pharyngocola]|uniref:TIGR03752 family integrating conjugative element protein n=1 Tax=Caviibacterium pharyngocola TaxID=28159 RepID=A0A2M8RV53_9PAST|nr:TIGR03752 family integrating conjugative element protein [Caviibacterium pharyngocola]PJG82782.1 TIGR03752 family integrating conjugative element protein [Caviibacterium pharyngocola]